MTVYMKKGDRLPLLRSTLTQSDNVTPINLTAATVTFTMRHRLTGVVKIAAGAVTIIDAVNGVVQYGWGAADTDTEGAYDAEFTVSIGGLPETVPGSGCILVLIEAKLV